MPLTGLAGISKKEIEHENIAKAQDIERIISKGCGATAAGPNGAINVWKDDEGNIQCEYQVRMLTMDSKIYKTMNAAIGWTKKRLKQIK